MRHKPGLCWCEETHTVGEAFDLTLHGKTYPPDVYDDMAQEGWESMQRDREAES